MIRSTFGRWTYYPDRETVSVCRRHYRRWRQLGYKPQRARLRTLLSVGEIPYPQEA